MNELVYLVTSILPFCCKRHFATSCFLLCDLASESAVLYNWPSVRHRRCRCRRHYGPPSFALVAAGLPIAEAMVVAEPGWLAETNINTEPIRSDLMTQIFLRNAVNHVVLELKQQIAGLSMCRRAPAISHAVLSLTGGGFDNLCLSAKSLRLYKNPAS